jgi:Transglycosylase-like domain
VRNRIVAFTVVFLTSTIPFFLLTTNADSRIPYLKHFITIEPTPEGTYGNSVPILIHRLDETRWYQSVLYVEAVSAYISSQNSIREAQLQQSQSQASASSTPVSSSGSSWQRVAMCEEGGSNNPTFGYFGIMPGSWAAYGGTAYSPTAGGSNWDTQVMIANRISGGVVPDANGCHSW